jgi:hypothetical protein
MEPQYDAQDVAIHDLATQNRALKEQRDELLAVAKEVLDFMHIVEWANHSCQDRSLDLRVALEVAIDKVEGR